MPANISPSVVPQWMNYWGFMNILIISMETVCNFTVQEFDFPAWQWIKGRIWKRGNWGEMKTPPNLDPNLAMTTSALGEESAFPVTPSPLEFAANSGHGSFRRHRALHEGLCKGNELIFPPAMVLFKESALWEVFETGDLSKWERFATEGKVLGVRLSRNGDQEHKYQGLGAREGKERIEF